MRIPLTRIIASKFNSDETIYLCDGDIRKDHRKQARKQGRKDHKKQGRKDHRKEGRVIGRKEGRKEGS